MDTSGEPLISLFADVDPQRRQSMDFDLSAAFRTVVEIREFHHRMASGDEFDRLNDVVEWLAEALGELYGATKVRAWENEAKTPDYSPFA